MELQQALSYISNPEPYDVNRYREAGVTLVNNRDKLHYRVFYKIPDPGAMTTNTDPEWDAIKAGSTGERCNCGNCRTIWPKQWPEFVEKETVTLRNGDKIYIVPEGGTYNDTVTKLEVRANDEGALFLTFLDDPFSDAFDFSAIFSGPKGFPLDRLAAAMAKQQKPAPVVRKFPEGAGINSDTMTLYTINKASATEVVIGIGQGYVTSKDPEKDFPH